MLMPTDFMFTKFTLQKQLFSVVRKYSAGKPSLVFLATRKEAVDSAKKLAEDSRGHGNAFVGGQQQAQRTRCSDAIRRDSTKHLQSSSTTRKRWRH